LHEPEAFLEDGHLEQAVTVCQRQEGSMVLAVH
jgi:hypothetical protein